LALALALLAAGSARAGGAKTVRVRGYALMAALRWLWAHQDTADAWWHPEVWLTPEMKEGE
jgi:hypothetical protein